MMRFIRLAAIAILPLVLILTVAQARRVDELRQEAAALEREQKELIEAKGKLVAAIALLSTRERVEAAALEEKRGPVSSTGRRGDLGVRAICSRPLPAPLPNVVQIIEDRASLLRQRRGRPGSA